MSRRGLQCLADISGGRPSRLRFYQTAAAKANPRDTHNPNRKQKERQRKGPWGPQHPKSWDGDGFAERTARKRIERPAKADTTDFIKRLLRASSHNAKKPDWRVLNVKNAEQNCLRAKVTSRQPSEEKQQFMAANPDVEATDDYLTHEVVKPGTFVELRRSNVIMHAVILGTKAHKGVTVVHSLSTNGEIIHHGTTDIMFSIPGLVDAYTAARCEEEETDDDVVEKLNEHIIAARVQVLKRINKVEKEVEECYHSTALRTARVLQNLPIDREKWTYVSTAAVAREVCGKNVVPVATMLAIHKFIMNKPKEYVASTTYLTTQNFTVRPRSEVENIELVSSMIGQRDPRVEVFIQKTKKILAAKKPEEPLSSPLHVTSNASVTFTDVEQAILRFLKSFVRPTRTIQKNPYLVPVATLIRRMDLCPEEQVTSAVVHGFLTDIGVLAPWDESSVITSRHEDPALRPAPDTEIHVPVVLGPEETYPQDIVADLRHDFGDTPVYIIDDANAEELDDGVPIEEDPLEPENYWIHVHIADPTSILHPTHSASRYARQLMSTQYFIQGTTPMIPASLTFAGLSLGSSGGAQNVITFSMKVDESGRIVDYDVRAAIIRNIRRIFYNQVDQVLGLSPSPVHYPFGGSMPPPTSVFLPEERHLNDLQTLLKVTERLTQRSVDDGVLMLYSNKPELSLTGDAQLPNVTDLSRPHLFSGFPDIRYAVRSGRFEGARLLVSECMKGAARVASRFFRDRNVPAVRRAAGAVLADSRDTHNFLLSKRDKLGYIEFAELWKTNAVFPSSHYTLETKGHAQMGVPDGEGYVRVSSPLRRFGDMVHHWQIKHALLGYDKPCFSEAWLANFATEMTLKEAAITKATSRQLNFWILSFIKRYMADPRKTDELNPLQAVHAVATQDAYIDRMNGRTQTRASIPTLGISARVYDVPLDLQAGDSFRVDYLQVNLGSDLTLLLKYHGV